MEGYTSYNNGLDLKKKIIPDDWKPRIDQILIDDLVGANRYFAETNTRLGELIAQIAKHAPAAFLRELRDRWNWHNKFYESLLEPALPHLLGKTSFDVSARQVELLERAYAISSLVDQATLVASIAIKPCVENWLNGPGAQLSEDDKYLLLTPPHSSFWVEYTAEHLDYLIATARDEQKSEELKARLIKDYHANDQQIFEGRLNAKFARYRAMTLTQLETAQQQLRAEKVSPTHHFYLTLERPALQAIRDLIIFDNYYEYKLVTSLIGISGFILRKNVLALLAAAKILPEAQGIYQYADEAVAVGLQKLRGYRQNVLSREVTPYQQRGVTCSAVCLMMALHYFDEVGLSSTVENDFHQRSQSAYIEGEHFAGLAGVAADAGFDTLLIHSEKKMFSNETGFFQPELYEHLLSEYQQYLRSAKKKITVRNGVPIEMAVIRQLLEQDYLVVIAGRLGTALHAVLAVGFNEHGLVIIDPLKGKKEVLRPGWFKTFTDTGIGRWILAVRRDQQPLQQLTDCLGSYRKEAESLLG